MKVKAKLIDENSDNEILLETEQLKVPLSLVSITIVFFFFCTQGRYSCQRFLWENGSIALMAGKKDLENHGSLKIWIRFQTID